MPGVEILSSNEVATEYAFNWAAYGIVACVIFAILVIVGITRAISYHDVTELKVCILLGIAAGIVLGSPWGSILQRPTNYVTEHKVIVSDEVPMTKFYERYEIVEQDGKIFTVREKTE